MERKITLFVSPNGNDNFSGRYPLEINDEGPFATIDRAISEIKSLPQGYDVEIMLRDGVHFIYSTLDLDAQICRGRKITLRNCCGERPVISSGYKLGNWMMTSDYPKGIPEETRGHIYEHPIHLINGRVPDVKTLFQGQKWLKRCQSKGFIPEDNSDLHRQCHMLKMPKGILSDYTLLTGAELIIRPSRQWAFNILEIENWDAEEDIITTKAAATYPMKKCHNFIDNISESVWIENSPGFLTERGSWYYDKERQKIYLWPEGNLDDIFIPILTEFIRIDGNEQENNTCVSNVTIEGITFTCGERFTINDSVGTMQHEWECCDSPNALLRLRDAHDCTVRNCVFEYSSNTAIRLDLNCQHNVISDNTIRYVGGSGVLLGGYGPGLLNVNRFNTVTRNHIYNCGEIYWQSMAIFVWHSSDNTISHNLIHDTGYIGIVVSGTRPVIFEHDRKHTVQDAGVREVLHARRDEIGSIEKWRNVLDKSKYANATDWFINVVDEVSVYQHVENNIIEKNDIYKVMQRMSDGNAIYLSDTCPGNIVRGNYVHDMDGLGGQQAIRTDEFLTGTILEDNVIYRCSGGGINLKHYNNHSKNNIIIDIRTVHEKDLRGEEAQMFFGYYSLVCVLDSKNLPESKKISIKDNVVVLCDPRQTYFRVGNNDGALLEDQITTGRLNQCILENNLYYATERVEEFKAFVHELNQKGLDKECVFGDPLITIENKKIMIEPSSPIFKMNIKLPHIEDTGI
jgi:parallel beta-helix repeat protein